MTDPGSRTIDRSARHVWRRVFAFALDLMVSAIVAGFLMLPVSMIAGADLGAMVFARVTECVTAADDHALSRQIDGLWPLDAGEIRRNQICTISLLGIGADRVFHSEVAKPQGSTDTSSGKAVSGGSRVLRIAIDDQDRPVLRPDLPDFSRLMTVLVLAFFTVHGRRPPGKAMLALSVQSQAGSDLSWPVAILRESLKAWPLVALFVLDAWSWMARPTEAVDLAARIAAARQPVSFDFWHSDLLPQAMIGAVAVVLWLAPFVFSKGPALHDRIAGTTVIRTRQR